MRARAPAAIPTAMGAVGLGEWGACTSMSAMRKRSKWGPLRGPPTSPQHLPVQHPQLLSQHPQPAAETRTNAQEQANRARARKSSACCRTNLQLSSCGDLQFGSRVWFFLNCFALSSCMSDQRCPRVIGTSIERSLRVVLVFSLVKSGAKQKHRRVVSDSAV